MAPSGERRWESPHGEVQGNAGAALVRDFAERLAGLAEEFGRQAVEIERDSRPVGGAPADREAVLVARAREQLDRRRLRARFLPAELFHEPAWDMLLALFIAQHERRTMNVKTLVSYAEAPATTSQRWIDHLAKLGLIDRVTDMMDRRRVEVQLSETGDDAIRRYLDAIG